MKTCKDWDAILAEYSEGEDSDAHDELNVMSVQKNAQRVAELIHTFVPGLDPTQRGKVPMGMNRADVLKSDLVAASRYIAPLASARPDESSSSRPKVSSSRAGDDAAASESAAPEASEAPNSSSSS